MLSMLPRHRRSPPLAPASALSSLRAGLLLDLLFPFPTFLIVLSMPKLIKRVPPAVIIKVRVKAAR